MTAITQAHAEWAVIDRLRAMLNEPPHEKYNVTQSYGLFVAILTWVMQRVRTPENSTNSTEDSAAISMKADLEAKKVEELPWGLKTDGCESLSHHFAGLSAFDFLKRLRNACCHGDARTVFPVNRNEELIGFQLQMRSDKDNTLRPVLFMEEDLRRIGSALADLYCKRLGESLSKFGDTQSMVEMKGSV